MQISILTLFPQLFPPILENSIIGRALKKGLFNYQLINIRNFGEGKHQVVDGKPYGGGTGMVIRADILAKALKSVDNYQKAYVVLMSASGKSYNQKKAREFSKLEDLIIVCGHYEGVDQRFIDKYVDEEISIGDYILTGGEIAAMAVIDSTVRLIPKVLKKNEAVEIESYSTHLEGLLEYPQYTRPEEFEGIKVPRVLISGDHHKVDLWRKEKSKEKTQINRPDLLPKK